MIGSSQEKLRQPARRILWGFRCIPWGYGRDWETRTTRSPPFLPENEETRKLRCRVYSKERVRVFGAGEGRGAKQGKR